MKALPPTFGFLSVFVIVLSCFSFSQGLQHFVSVGCFKDSLQDRALPDLIINHRITHPIIDWSNLSITINSCAKAAQDKGYVYFALQFWGECWAGSSGHLTYDKYGFSTNCEKGIGKHYTNFVYRNTGVENECEKPKILDSENRAMTYTRKSDIYKCDKNLVQGWYRFTGKAGNDMANNCIASASSRCDTLMAGWLQSPQPSPSEGIKPAQVCFHIPGSSCCEQPEPIKIRNCGRFYVYKLQPPRIGCFSRYCGNGKYV